MTRWIQQLLWHSLMMSGLALAYWGITAGPGRRYAAKWLYLVGVIVLVGFLVPARPVLTLRAADMPAFLQAAARDAAPAMATGGTATAPATATEGFPWRAAFALWALGAALVLAYHMVSHRRFARAVKRWRTEVTDERTLAQFQAAKASLGLQNHHIGLARCPLIRSPMLLRLDRPTVLLPQGEGPSYDLCLILQHELVHYKRRDLLCRWAMLLCMAIHWFNPVIYRLIRLVTAQCELSCDERVVAGRDMESRHRYALSILGVAANHARDCTLLTTYFYGGKDIMKKRIHSVYEPSKTRAGALLLVCALLLTGLAGTSIAAAPAAPQGEIQVALPQTPVKLDEKVDEYIVSWTPMEGIKAYHIGVYYQVGVERTAFVDLATGEPGEPLETIWCVAGGWIGPGQVTDDAGVTYEVPVGVWESLTLDGDATEADLTALINKQTEPIELNAERGADATPSGDPVEYAKKEALLSCTMVMVAVREAGEPIVQEISIPVA